MRLFFYAVLMIVLFIQPLAKLIRHSAQFDLHSHIPMVPLIVGYLLYIDREHQTSVYRTSLGGAVLLGTVAVGALAAAVWWRGTLSVNDHLALTTLAFVSLIAAAGFLSLGSQWMRAAAFPMAFLLFMIPMPDAMVNALELASMRASADAAAWFITLTGTPMVRDEQLFALPGIALEVAQQCSGIRSSWVLFITSVLASNLFLTSPWRRLLLVAVVIPLGIIRNGFRVMVIALLCVHIGPHMIDSFIHHHGGPVFFVLSLGPFFLVLLWLRRGDRRPATP